MKSKSILCGLLLVLTFSINGQHLDLKKGNMHYNQAMRFYQQKEYSKAAEEMKLADTFRPNHPAFVYNLAAIYSLAGNNHAALEVLNRLVSFKLFFEVDKDSDFVSLFNDDLFRQITMQLYENLEPIINSKFEFSINQDHLLTESVAYDSVQKIFYVGSVHKRKIVSYDSKGIQKDFIKEGQDGIWSVFGMCIDPSKRLLYACTGVVDQTEGIDSSEIRKSGIFIYDLESGLLRDKIIFDDSVQHLLGDVTLDSKGNVYTSDSRTNVIYLLSDDGKNLTEFYKSDDFSSLQGIAFSNDDQYLFVADYSTGIHRINTGTREKIIVKYPDNLAAIGIDGLYYYKSNLIAIQNGVKPNRVIRMMLNDNQEEIASWEILESNNPLFNEPTLGVVNGSNFYFIANSQWEFYGKNGVILPQVELQKPTILKLNLD